MCGEHRGLGCMGQHGGGTAWGLERVAQGEGRRKELKGSVQPPWLGSSHCPNPRAREGSRGGEGRPGRGQLREGPKKK